MFSQFSRYSCRCFLRLSSWDWLVYPFTVVPCHHNVCLQCVELQHLCLPFSPWPFVVQVVLACVYIYPKRLSFAVGDIPPGVSLSVLFQTSFFMKDDILFCPNTSGKMPSHSCHCKLEDKIERHLWMSWKLFLLSRKVLKRDCNAQRRVVLRFSCPACSEL